MTRSPIISVICCAHNEEEYVDKSVPRILHALETFPSEVIFIADRCTDKTVDKVRNYNVKVIEKEWKKWENSYSESLQTGYLNAKALFIGIVDADILVPANFFRELMQLVRGNIASVGGRVVTYPDTLWNRVMYSWEKTRRIAPLGREPRGAARIIRKNVLDDIEGFQDVPTPDTDMDVRLAKKGYKSATASHVTVYHIRHVCLKTIVNGQINSGRGRYALGMSFARTMGHAIFRLRPLVTYGWLLERQRRLRNPKEHVRMPNWYIEICDT